MFGVLTEPFGSVVEATRQKLTLYQVETVHCYGRAKFQRRQYSKLLIQTLCFFRLVKLVGAL